MRLTGGTMVIHPTRRREASPSAIVKHSIVIAGHRTSISLEGVFWSRLCDIAAGRRLSVAALVAEVDARRGTANLSSAIRVFVLQEAIEARTAAGQ